MSYRNLFCICPDCEDNIFPSIGNVLDCNNSVYNSEISGVILLPSGAELPTDWKTLAGWTNVIDNSDTTNAKAKYFEGMGNVPVPSKTFINNSKGYKRITDKLYSLVFDVVNINDSMYQFLRFLQCNPKNFSFWIHTVSDHVIGSGNGITPSFTQVDFPYERGEDAIQKGLLNIEWRAMCDPERAYIENYTSIVGNNIAPDVMGSGADNIWGANTNLWGI